MLEIIVAGGWMMGPILLCSVVALGIIAERFWTLRRRNIVPEHMVAQIWHWKKNDQLSKDRINTLRAGSPMGRIMAAGLTNLNQSREVMKESIEETGRHVVHELERYLNTLGTIASIGPLMGLLGTVLGIIQMFSGIMQGGIGNPQVLAGGLAQALITTVAGLVVAIPALIFYRHFHGKVDALVVEMEQEAIKMVEIMHGDRTPEAAEGAQQ